MIYGAREYEKAPCRGGVTGPRGPFNVVPRGINRSPSPSPWPSPTEGARGKRITQRLALGKNKYRDRGRRSAPALIFSPIKRCLLVFLPPPGIGRQPHQAGAQEKHRTGEGDVAVEVVVPTLVSKFKVSTVYSRPQKTEVNCSSVVEDTRLT
jgi:hypothetical protein